MESWPFLFPEPSIILSSHIGQKAIDLDDVGETGFPILFDFLVVAAFAGIVDSLIGNEHNPLRMSRLYDWQ
jgi:hypothetical protein